MASLVDVETWSLGMNLFARFAQDESGATAIEYGLIAALISVGIIVAATALGGSLSGLFNGISNTLDNSTDAL
jgi:pilus assembly protein Flp/PilA